MRHDWQMISKKLSTMKRGEQEYFHTGRLGTGDPVLVTKGEPQSPTLITNAIKQSNMPRKAKSIIDPSLATGKMVGELSDETN